MRKSERDSGRSTGPKTPEGKEKSSQNSTTHGCRSKKVVILEGERQEDYDALREGWWTDFEPEKFAAKRLVEKLILNDWLVERASRWLLAAQAAVAEGGDPMVWDSDKIHRLDLMLRYQTTAERAFYRSWQAAQNFRKDAKRELELQGRLQKANESEGRRERVKEEAVEEEGATLLPKDTVEIVPDIPMVEQWVEVRVHNGKTTTKVTPSNDEVTERAQKMMPPAEMVVRRFLFWTSVPKEYYWATDDEAVRANGGALVFQMMMEEWCDMVEREKCQE